MIAATVELSIKAFVMKIKIFIKLVVMPLLFAGQVITPTYSFAQMSAVGRSAQSFGNEIAGALKNQGANYADGSVNLGGENNIKIEDLFPGTSSGNKTPPSYFFPDSDSGALTVDGLTSLQNNNAEINKAGAAYNNSLLNDAKSSNPSLSGAAYQILLNHASKPKEKFENDPMLKQSFDTFNQMDLIAEGFGDCKISNEVTSSERAVHMPSYERCENIKKPASDCVAQNLINVETSVIDIHAASQGRDVVTIKFDLKNGSWQSIAPSDGEEKKANIPVVNYAQLCGGGRAYKTELVGAWDWIDHGLVGSVDSTVNYTVIEFPSCENQLVGTVQIRDTTSNSDLDYVLGGRFNLRFSKLISGEWTPTSCLESIKGIEDGFCTGKVEIEPITSEDGCRVISSIKVCPGDSFFNALGNPPLAGASKLAEKISVKEVQCNFNSGTMDCWKDPSGKTHCPVNPGTSTTSCDALKSKPECGFISSKCVEGAKGPSGACYVYEDTFDCGYSVNIPDYSKNSKYSCEGSIKCMGDECLDIGSEKNPDFAKAAALLNAAQFMAQDMSCSDGATGEGGDGNVDLGCRVFSGTPGSCKIAVGGAQNCCEKPENISLADYLTMLMAVPKLDSAIMALDKGSALKGTYQALRDPAMQGWTEVSKPFASYGENISGAVSEFVKPLNDVYSQVMQQLKDTVRDIIKDAIQNGLSTTGLEGGAAAGMADQASKQAAEQATESIMNNIGGAASTIMTVYTVYVVTMMVIQIVWACEQEEFELNAKRQLKSCTHVGSYCKSKALGVCIEKREAYCCYNSPLSRIINEQVRGQKGLGHGDPKSPQCDGLTMDQISSVDWDKINLDEWLGILQENGKFPTPGGLTMDALTGGGSIFNTEGDRLNSQDRAQKRLEGLDVDKVRNKAEKTISLPK